jgi:hypothetical protein
MQDPGCELRRSYLLSTPVNKEQKKGGSLLLDLHPPSRRELRFPTDSLRWGHPLDGSSRQRYALYNHSVRPGGLLLEMILRRPSVLEMEPHFRRAVTVVNNELGILPIARDLRGGRSMPGAQFHTSVGGPL